ncbi:MAG: hypothetical protein LBJ67_17655 [Planctomycetaceae bacterium]|jgi:hypothetical protein|nr:hypothetical protein [Planctomycetaceae bacterium]
MSSITSGLTSSSFFYSAVGRTQSSVKPVQSSQSESQPSTTKTDIYIPGTEGKVYESFTEYIPLKSGGRWEINNDGTSTFKPAYSAITLIPTPGNGHSNASSNILQYIQSKFPSVITADDIDKNIPGAILQDGQWILVEDFIENNAKNNEATNNVIEEFSQAVIDEKNKPLSFALTLNTKTKALELRDLQGQLIEPVAIVKHTTKEERAVAIAANPSLIWSFEGENLVFKNHDILNAVFSQTFKSTDSQEAVVDSYGYTYSVPGSYESPLVSGNGSLNASIKVLVTEGQNTIESVDTTDLYGLTLQEREQFFAEWQKIFDQSGVQLDAEKQVYSFIPAGLGCGDKSSNGGWGISLDLEDNITVNQIIKLRNDNPVLQKLFSKVEKIRNGEIADDTLAQQYSIRVTDNNGNRLVKNQIIIEAKNGNQIEMSVEQFKQLDRKAIAELLK